MIRPSILGVVPVLLYICRNQSVVHSNRMYPHFIDTCGFCLGGDWISAGDVDAVNDLSKAKNPGEILEKVRLVIKEHVNRVLERVLASACEVILHGPRYPSGLPLRME